MSIAAGLTDYLEARHAEMFELLQFICGMEIADHAGNVDSSLCKHVSRHLLAKALWLAYKILPASVALVASAEHSLRCHCQIYKLASNPCKMLARATVATICAQRPHCA